jgi:hypothetical protein
MKITEGFWVRNPAWANLVIARRGSKVLEHFPYPSKVMGLSAAADATANGIQLIW